MDDLEGEGKLTKVRDKSFISLKLALNQKELKSWEKENVL